MLHQIRAFVKDYVSLMRGKRITFEPERTFYEAQRKLITARSKLREQGIGPTDPCYPDLEDILGYHPVDRLIETLEKMKSKGLKPQSGSA